MRNATLAALAEAPEPPPAVNLSTDLRASGAGSARLKAVEPASPYDEARWLVEACGFRL